MKADDMNFYHQATTVICGSLDLQIVLKRCLNFFRLAMPIDSISAHMYDTKANAIVHVAGEGVPAHTLKGLTIPFSAELKQKWDNRLQDDPLEVMNNVGDHEVGKHVWEHIGSKEISALLMLLTIEDDSFGMIVITSHGSSRYNSEHARLIRMLQGPFAIALSNTLKHQEVVQLKSFLEDENKFLNRQLHRISGDAVIGEEFGLKYVMESVRQVAPQKSLVLLLGETGAGKEVIANAIHYSSNRAKEPFIKVNCGAIPEPLIDSELFGHEKGAFTGALSLKRGLFERANKGTIFLDEIGELPLNAQVRLLRVLQNKEIDRVGGTTPIPVDIRIIVATHRNLQEMVKSGEFREDLWFRINVFPITIPPLRQRKCDIPALVRFFMEKKAKEMNLKDKPALAGGSLEKLQAYDWPGNVRELENIIERTIIQNMVGTAQKPLDFASLTDEGVDKVVEEKEETGDIPLPSLLLEDIIRSHIKNVLQITGARIQGDDGAATLLGVNPSTLRNKMKKLGIFYGRSKDPKSIQHLENK